MELWFTEKHTENVKLSIKVDKQLYSGQSDYQRIDVFTSPEFGVFLTLDGYMMLTEKDEFIYHEMMVHVPMAVHPNVKNVLVIGAGDGGVVRVNIKYQDGLRYVRGCEDKYDLIIVDSTDPFGPGEGLFTKEFYGNCFRALKEDGIVVNQHESPYYSDDALAMQRAHKRIVQSFDISRVYQAHIPTYPSGHWLFGFSSKKYHPVKDIDEERWNSLGIQTKYYNTNLHKGAFYLPNYVENLLKHVENVD